MNIIKYCNKVIEYSFYSLFLFVPLIFWGSTSELFELNKIWLTYGITIIIVCSWLIKIILSKKFNITRTPLDIPLILFFIFQTISTVFSLDSYVSFFGYYSRFNGGLLSTISYVLLYFAFTANFDQHKTFKLLKVIIIAGLFVVLWGIPSHFGYDPTCYIFRGELNVSCWTDAFKPTVRIFSTLGQPAWLAAYLAVLLPISITMLLNNFIFQESTEKKNQVVSSILELFKKNYLLSTFYLILSTFLYLSLLYTGTRAGFIAFWGANSIFWFVILLKRYYTSKVFLSAFLILNTLFFILNFFIGTPIPQLNKFTYSSINSLNNSEADNEVIENIKVNEESNTNSITDSADIRRIVWKGALDAWKAYPVFGSGVETFAFAYYKYRPAEHNLTSEWDYLYNKAHNEYLNYLTTTGILGLGSYILIISVFIYQFIKILFNSSKSRIAIINNRSSDLIGIDYKSALLSVGLFTGWLSVLITNFFGFSVVIINLFFFLIPAFVFILNQKSNYLNVNSHTASSDNLTIKQHNHKHITVYQYLAITFLLLATCYFLLILFRHWQADQSYSLGYNLSKANYPKEALDSLTNAVSIRPSEPVFQDELSMTALQLSLVLFQQKEATTAAKIAQSAIEINTELLSRHPNYLTFWKSRIRLFYALGEIAPEYKQEALKAAKITAQLAPTDAKIWYNLGVLYGQTGKEADGINILNKTIEMKPDYLDAYYALGLLYRQIAVDDQGIVTDSQMQTKAIKTLNNLLELSPEHTQTKQTLKEWQDLNN